MNDLTLDELNLLLAVFEQAGIGEDASQEGAMLGRIKQAQSARAELEDMSFDDCLGGACKL